MSSHIDPMHQFLVKKVVDISVFGVDISLTNSAIAMLLTSVASCAILYAITFCGFNRNIVRARSAIISFTLFIENLVSNAVGHKISTKEKKYAFYIFCAFLFIWFSNLFGMIPGGFAPTAQFAVTIAAGFTVIAITLSISFSKYGLKMFKIFLPHGAPLWLAPLMIPLEIMSYAVRPFSLGIRLGANIFAGHTMLEVVAAITIGSGAIGAMYFPIILAINAMEFFVITLQAYIFALLASTYIGEALGH